MSATELSDDELIERHAFDPSQTVDLMALVLQHRRRDELVVAAAMAVLETGSATGSGVSLAQRVLALYEEHPDHG